MEIINGKLKLITWRLEDVILSNSVQINSTFLAQGMLSEAFQLDISFALYIWTLDSPFWTEFLMFFYLKIVILVIASKHIK